MFKIALQSLLARTGARFEEQAAKRAAGLNGFCRLRTAPSLPAMLRKSGPEPISHVVGLPEITMIGVSGRC